MDITVKELKEKLDNAADIVLIDVREPYERAEFNIGGQLIPIGQFRNALPNLDAPKDKEVVVYCRSGKRSGLAQQFMQQEGYQKVRNLTGGMLAWMDEYGG